jgi:hypothetical protein
LSLKRYNFSETRIELYRQGAKKRILEIRE